MSAKKKKRISPYANRCSGRKRRSDGTHVGRKNPQPRHRHEKGKVIYTNK